MSTAGAPETGDPVGSFCPDLEVTTREEYLGSRITDFTGGFNGWNIQVLRALDLSSLTSEGYTFQIELKYRASRLGFQALEFPIIFEERRAGQSKMSARNRPGSRLEGLDPQGPPEKTVEPMTRASWCFEGTAADAFAPIGDL